MPDPELFPGAAAPKKKPRVSQWQLDALYDDYPRHEGRAAAENAARTLLKSRKIGFPELLRRVQAYAAYVEREQIQYAFIPLPATWFRNRWKDDVSEMGSQRVTRKTIQPGHDPRVQAEWEDRTRRHQQAARLYWQSLSPAVRRIVRGCQFRDEQHEFETAMRAFDEANRPGFEEAPNAHG